MTYFDTKKLRRLWQYQVLTALKKAVRAAPYGRAWSAKLGRMFVQYPSGFDCHAMPESGPVERLVIYLCKYVSSPPTCAVPVAAGRPISIRRIESYDGERVRFRYEDHRRGPVQETLSATEFIGPVCQPGRPACAGVTAGRRMIRHLTAKNFRMVRDYGIYARTVRNKVHALGVQVLAGLQRAAQRVRELMGRQSAARPEPSESASNWPVTEPFAERAVRCLGCATEMILVRVWSASGGLPVPGTADRRALRSVGQPERRAGPGGWLAVCENRRKAAA